MSSSKPSLLVRLVEDVVGLDAGELRKALDELKQLQREAPSGGRRRQEIDPMADLDEPGLTAWDINYRRKQAAARQPPANLFARTEAKPKGLPGGGQPPQSGRGRQRKAAAAAQPLPIECTLAPEAARSLSAPSEMPAGAPASRRGGRAVALGGLPPGMLQHAFALAELLGPPMSLRESWGMAAGNSWAYPTVQVGEADARGVAAHEPISPEAEPAFRPAEAATPTGEPPRHMQEIAPHEPEAPPAPTATPMEVHADLHPDSLTAELLFRLTVRSVAADQKISPREYAIFQDLRKVLHLDEGLEKTILQQERDRAAARTDGPRTSEVQPTGLYAAAFRLAVADGVISADERLLLEQLAELLKLGPEQKAHLEELGTPAS